MNAREFIKQRIKACGIEAGCIKVFAEDNSGSMNYFAKFQYENLDIPTARSFCEKL